MDKNFINIDDLVRQRLAGAEERERSGAWLRMSELLEKEMPQVRPAGFIWRRMLGALSVILLIGALSLGGYELNSFVRTQTGTNDAVIAAAPASTHTNADNNSTVVSNVDNNTTSNTNANPGAQPSGYNNAHSTAVASATTSDDHTSADNNKNSKADKKDNDHKNVIAANIAPAKDKKNSVKSTGKQDQQPVATAENKTAANTATKNNTPGNNNAGTNKANKNTSSSNTDTKAVAANDKSKAKEGKENGTATPSSSVAVNNNVPAKDNSKTKEGKKNTTATPSSSVAVNNNVPAKENNKAKEGKKNTNATPSSSVAVNNNVPAKENSTKENATGKTGSNATADNTPTGNKTKTTGKAKNSNAVANVTKPANTTAPAKKNENRGTGATTGAVAVAKENTDDEGAEPTGEGATTTAPGKKTATNKTVKVADMALGSTTPGTVKPVNNNAHKANTNVNKPGKSTVNSNNASPKTTKGTNNTVAAVTTGNKAPQYNAVGNLPKKPVTAVSKPGANPIPSEDISLVNKKKGKRVIEKIMVYHRPVRSNAKETIYWLDTVSMGSVTEEYDLVDPKVLAVTGVPKTGNAVASSDDPDSDSSPAGKSASKSFADSKENNFDKKTVGAKTMENLNAAFNDIKYNAGHPTFQTGIIAGINATFFGPNNFKGFQFGITGKLSFGESLSIMSELKYFHRMNNNYAVNDDYYSYTPVSGGYSKQQVLNPYIVSTLHSFEMPISVRYNIGNFGIFFGPNMVYTFGVNTGNYPITVHNPNPTIVSTPGNDNGPKLTANDFNARFGLGYLFGFSYQVSPKVMIDFRDVQTFWDNSSTPGAKAVSTKLYKSPSFQLSIGYRFGGGKSKEE